MNWLLNTYFELIDSQDVIQIQIIQISYLKERELGCLVACTIYNTC